MLLIVYSNFKMSSILHSAIYSLYDEIDPVNKNVAISMFRVFLLKIYWFVNSLCSDA